MTIAAIWAQEMNGGIGYHNRLPWRHKPDVEHFWKTIGMDTVIIGHNTFSKNENLFRRYREYGHYIILSNHAAGSVAFDDKRRNSVHYVSNIGSALSLTKEWGENAWVVGGAKTFALFASVIDVFVMTKIYERYPCDSYIPWGLTPPNARAWDFYDLEPNKEGVSAKVGIYVTNRIPEKEAEFVVNNVLRRDLEWEL